MPSKARRPAHGGASRAAPGQTSRREARPADDAARFDLWARDALAGSAQAARGVRDAAAGSGDFDLDEFEQADLLTVRFGDGSVYYTHPGDWADRCGLTRAGTAPTSRSATGAGRRLALPFDLRAGAGTRSTTGSVAVDSYEIARLTPRTALDGLFDFAALFDARLSPWFGQAANPKAAALAGKLCWAYENATLDPAAAGTASRSGTLLRWTDRGWAPLAQALDRDASRQVLLLLHGTASSTEGSFKGLWQTGQASSPAPDWLHRVVRQGQGPAPIILAFEHRSLTASPLLNAVDLARALVEARLPAGARIQMLSHSRGGLVGEVFGLMLAADATEDTERDARVDKCLGRFFGSTHPDHGPASDFAGLRQAVRKAGWSAAEFVRVACPARGTLLADRRTDLFLSLLLRAFGLAFPQSALVDRLAGLVKGLVAARADARHLPGLEAMIPGSPLTLLLNGLPPSLPQAGRLHVVAGDAKAEGLGGLLTVLSDVFYGLHDHDYVVHTHAMFGGPRRKDAVSLRVEDASVNHLGYFEPGTVTRQAVLSALAGDAAAFSPLADDERRTRGLLEVLDNDLSRNRFEDAFGRLPERPDRPLLLVLPGIMGSELSASLATRDSPIWLSLSALLTGDLDRLDIGTGLEPTGVLSAAYERLLEAAQPRFHVVVCPFDWRQPIDQLGQGLRRRLEQLLDRAAEGARPQPVHVIAHSMGGLVARLALDAGDPASATWQRFTQAGGRLLMLGTPNRGSYVPVQFLLRQHAITQWVALGALGVDARDLAGYGAGFAGLMGMLPHEPDPVFGDLFHDEPWARARALDDRVVSPDPAVLERCRAVRQTLAAGWDALRRSDRVFYVAGQASTPLGLRRVDGWLGSSLRLGSTEEGDGTVPWTSCLDKTRTWYVDASHGFLADVPDAFEGYFELLLTGHTARLSTSRPVTRSTTATGSPALFPLPSLASLPEDPALLVLGGGTQRNAPTTWVPPAEIRVVHGSLDYARYPLIVGHYGNDGVYGAVDRVDLKLDGLVRRMIQLELVTGKGGTATYVRGRSADGGAPPYPGAIIIGLGQVGELTGTALTEGVTRGVLRFAVEHLAQDAWAPRDGPVLIRLSTLLVGTHVQALSKRDSMSAVLAGIWRAGHMLADGSALGGRKARLVEVELVEIEESVALDAAYTLHSLLARPEWEARYRWKRGVLESRDGGLRGFRPGTSDSLWQRLIARQDDDGGLRFELIAERARVESTQVAADVSSLRHYIDRVSDAGAVRAPDADPAFGRVLFQLLLPQALKTRLSNFDRTVLVVDDQTAALPWELLAPPNLDGRTADTAQPLAVQAGLVRQRITHDFRVAPAMPAGWTALVVGEPSTEGWTDRDGRPLSFARLPGARAEAELVARSLAADERRPWRVSLLEPEATVERVRTALLQQPWRVLHLAGHGVVDHWVRRIEAGSGGATAARDVLRTGLLLSHQQVLTAGDVEQLDPAPEFVFINGCYSAQDGAELQTGGRKQSVLASSLALQFIKIGARAVVAAGWRVHDGDGQAFAAALYAALLEGQRFGDAVCSARKEVYRTARTNTWGAYQAYGDPDWQLVGNVQRGPNDAQAQGSGRLRGAARCMSAAELAERILQAVAIAGDKPAAELVHQLQALETDLRADPERARWLTDSAVLAAFGAAYRELGRPTEAWDWFRQALLIPGSRLSIGQLEQACRSLTRVDPGEGRVGPSPAAQAAGVLGALSDLDARVAAARPLAADTAPAAPLQSVESRATILGSAKLVDARAQLRAGRKAEAAALTVQAASEYARSHAASAERDAPRRAYTLANAVMLASAARLIDGGVGASPDQAAWCQSLAVSPGADPTEIADRIERLLDQVQHNDEAGIFWDYTNALELRLARAMHAIAAGRATERDDLQALPTLMRHALVRWPAPVEIQSLRASLEFAKSALEEAGHRATPRDRSAAAPAAIATLPDALVATLAAINAHRVRGGRVEG